VADLARGVGGAPVILHVDDNEGNRYAVSRVLRKAGFEVVEAVTGAEALERVLLQPDLIVLDVRLPDIDGFEVCRRVKADEATSIIPVLHLTASFISGDKKAEGLDAGADAYLVRPVEPIELIATVNALLRQRRTEEALRQSESRFRRMADSAPVLIWMADESQACTWFNRSWLEFVGCSLSDAVAGGCYAYVHPGDIERWQQEYDRHFAAREPYSLEYRLRRRDGEYRWVLDRAVPLGRESSDFSGFMGTCVDVTDRRRYESMLSESEARFRQLAEDRTRLLEFERAVRRDAEEANRLKDEFLATLSHELRTPLNAIVGWTTILQQGDVPPAVVAEGVATIERNAKAQSQLIEDLLDVSRILSGKLRLDLQPIDFAPVVEAAVTSVFPSSTAKGVSLRHSVPADGASLFGDPTRLQQVVWNLLSNAIKFTPRGGRVDALLTASDSIVELVIADSGQGIAPEFLPHVFDRFRQADASTTRTHTGLGLGLAIVRHLVEQHGGTIHAESRGEGCGAIFTIRLPAMTAARVPGPKQPDRAARDAAASATLHGEVSLANVHVLVVDDEPDSRNLLKRLLEQRHAVVQARGSVADALQAIDERAFDVVLSDIAMPGRDGYDLVRHLRALPGEKAAIPAIALTAFARADDRRLALHAGFQHHISKPVDPDELFAVIASVARRAGTS
jgi:PAS domain S-box-containing protein